MAPVIDSQIHVWAPPSPDHPWPAEHARPHRDAPLETGEVLRRMDEAGVDRAILVPPTWQAYDNSIVLDAANTWPKRFRVMGRFDIHQRPAPNRIASWCTDTMVGMRITLYTSEGLRSARSGELDWIWEHAQRAHVPIAIFAPRQQQYIGEVVARYPELRLMVCHAALPVEARDGDLWQELAPLWSLASHPNVAVKASALPNYVNEGWPYPTVRAVVRRIVGEFGAARTFWGSDLSRLSCPYSDLVEMFQDLDFLDVRERNLVLGQGVADWLGWSTD